MWSGQTDFSHKISNAFKILLNLQIYLEPIKLDLIHLRPGPGPMIVSSQARNWSQRLVIILQQI